MAYKPRGQCWAPYLHTCAHSTWAAGPGSPQEEGSRRGESAWPRTPLATGSPRTAGGRAPNAHTHTRTPTRGTSVRAPQPTPLSAHSTHTSHGKSAPQPLLLSTATQQWRNPRPHAKNAPDLRRGNQGAGTQRRRRRPPTRGRGRGLRPGRNPGALHRQHARGTCAAGGQRAHLLPRVETGPLHRRRLVSEAAPRARPQ